jgi:hypothetical protein
LSIGLFTISATMKVHGNYLHNVFPGLALCAFGMGLSFISMTLAATSGVPKHFSGLASGLLNTSQQIGGALGLAILAAVYASTFKSEIATNTALSVAKVNGYKSGLHVGVGLAIAAALVALLVVRNKKVDAKDAMGV